MDDSYSDDSYSDDYYATHPDEPLPPQTAPDGTPWEQFNENSGLPYFDDLDDDPCFARFCNMLRRWD
jgi:hypothetical protein